MIIVGRPIEGCSAACAGSAYAAVNGTARDVGAARLVARRWLRFMMTPATDTTASAPAAKRVSLGRDGRPSEETLRAPLRDADSQEPEPDLDSDRPSEDSKSTGIAASSR